MQKQFLIIVAILVCIGLAAAASQGQTPLGPAFPHQGQLKNNGLPASGSFDLQFKLFDAGANGTQIGTAQCADNVAVSGGLFAVSLDFGAQFDGSARWLEVGVRADSTAGNCATGSYTTLAPRQPISATPYASYAAGPWAKAGSNLAYTAGSVGIGTTSPTTSLHIVDPAVAQVKLERTGGASLLMQAGSTVNRIGSSTTTRLGFLIGGNDKMTLDTSGHLGIGTASPDANLHVFRASAGSITANTNAPLALESNTTNYLNILAPDANETGVLFGRP